MNDHLFFHAVDYMALFPGEVVMVFEIQQHFGSKISGHMLVDQRVIGGGIAPHQLHCRPVFLAFLRIQRQPSQPLQFARQVRELAESNLTVMVAYGSTGAAAPAVGEQRHVSSSPNLTYHGTRSTGQVVHSTAGGEVQHGYVSVCTQYDVPYLGGMVCTTTLVRPCHGTSTASYIRRGVRTVYEGFPLTIFCFSLTIRCFRPFPPCAKDRFRYRGHSAYYSL